MDSGDADPTSLKGFRFAFLWPSPTVTSERSAPIVVGSRAEARFSTIRLVGYPDY